MGSTSSILLDRKNQNMFDEQQTATDECSGVASIQSGSFKANRTEPPTPLVGHVVQKSLNNLQHEMFLRSLQDDSLTVNEARIYVQEYPECLKVVDSNTNRTALQIACDNNDEEMYNMFVEHIMKAKHSITGGELLSIIAEEEPLSFR